MLRKCYKLFSLLEIVYSGQLSAPVKKIQPLILATRNFTVAK